MIRNNQNGRRRGRGGARPPQGGGPSGNYGNTNGGGSRIDTRQRGNASQLLEKYKAMARDATQNGDRVQAEFYMQYADHYFRVLNEFRARDPQPAPRSTYDDDDDGYPAAAGQNYVAAADRDDDDGDDQQGERSYGGDRQANGERPRGDGYAGQNGANDRPRDGQRGYAPRDGNAGGGAGGGAGDAGRAAAEGRPDQRYAGRSDAPRGDGRQSGPRRDDDRARPNGDQSRDGSRWENGRAAAGDGYADERDAGALPPRATTRAMPERQPAASAVIGLPGPATLTPTFAPVEVAAPPADAGETPPPRKRGRPRKVVADAPGDA